MYTKTEAAFKILKDNGKPLPVREIIQIALSKKMIITTGKTPDATLEADFINERKRRVKRGESLRFVRTAPGIWGLAEWGLTHVDAVKKKGSKNKSTKAD